tara:strand:- start:9985 stop:10098 length:114 start_codon:yes stop_codon:yes gene_type:complete
MKKIWNKIKEKWYGWKERRRIKKKMKEIQKRDPFIYD